jgi:putative transposase
MEYTYKIRIYPGKTQKKELIEAFGANRFFFNTCLKNNKIIIGNMFTASTMTHYGAKNKANLNHLNNYLKKTHDWYRHTESTSLQSTRDNFLRGFQSFFRGNGYPRFKSRKNPVQSIRIANNKNSIRIENNHLRLNKFGYFKYHDNREIQGRILNTTIKLENGRWFACVLVDKDIKDLPKTGKITGIDLGKRHLLNFANGDVTDKLNLKKENKEVSRLNRELSRRTKGSNNYNKTLHKLRKAYNKLNDKKNDFYHKLSTQIVSSYDFISMEKLQIKNMLKEKKSARSTHEIAWYKLTSLIEQKASMYAKDFIKVPPHYTSKDCSVCGYRYNDLERGVSSWLCPECNTMHDRDVNAARNILFKGLKSFMKIYEGGQLSGNEKHISV